MIRPGLLASSRRRSSPGGPSGLPTVVGYSGANHSASSFNANVPAGAAAGDTMLLIVGSAWGINTGSLPSGATSLVHDTGYTWQGDVTEIVLTSGHISDGYVTFGMNGNGHIVYNAVVFEGPVVFGDITTLRDVGSNNSRTLNSASSVTTDMLMILYGDVNDWDDPTVSPGTEQITVSVSTNGSASMNTYTPVSDGVFTMTVNYLYTHIGKYLAMVPVYVT